MFSGAQISLYPMCDDFVAVIMDALGALDPYRDRLRIETDDISTLIVGPPEVIFPAMRDLFTAAATTGRHVTMHATISRGCPGEPDDPICTPGTTPPEGPVADRIADGLAALQDAPLTGQDIAAQLSFYMLGATGHMDEIYGVIDLIRASGVFERPKNFCTKLRGDAGPVMATIYESFTRFGPPDGHVTLDLTLSANSPSPR